MMSPAAQGWQRLRRALLAKQMIDEAATEVEEKVRATLLQVQVGVAELEAERDRFTGCVGRA